MAILHIDELSDHKYMGRISGTEGGYQSGEYIIDILESYGYETSVSEIALTEESGDPKMFAPVFIENGKITIKDANGGEKEFFLHEDFTIASIDSNIFEEKNEDEIILEGIAATPENASGIGEDQDFFPLISQFAGVSSGDLHVSTNLVDVGGYSLEYHTRFFYYENEVDFSSKVPYIFNSTVILPFEDLNQELTAEFLEMEIRFDYPEIPEYPARNISGFLPGKGRSKEDPGPVILIGAAYDGVYQGENNRSVLSASAAATNLEIARVLSTIEKPFEKSIEFIFWDNQSQSHKSSEMDGSNYFDKIEQRSISMALNEGYYYIDVNYPYLDNGEPLNFMVLPAQRGDANSYLIGLDMEKRLKQSNIDYKRHHYWTYASIPLRELRLNSATSIGVGNPYPAIGYFGWDNMERMDLRSMNNIGQILIDTLTMEPRIME